ncbi:MAG: YebC/PmpR family DNA-binding transcriptional regulator [Thermoanaerobaculales bacterium]|jgi:YebC/PmpR family DNA-binding regulatory protein|nr:YebC/PmpR family DNA-binding transcriptional regulator [Thermoanaerobaculales bacterium]
MSGHNKWSTIKHKKGRADAKRGKIFTKLIREITVSARESGGDADSNPRLRAAVAAAKIANMPADNIKRAIQRGTGELPGVTYEEVHYEGYGPGGVAVLLQTLTDNRNRTTPEVRHLFTKHGGNLGENGCVSWLFSRRGLLLIERADGLNEDALMERALDAGAEDLDTDDEDYFRVYTAAEELHVVKERLEESGVEVANAEIDMEPSTTQKLEGKQASQMIRLMEAFEDHDDVQNVWANFDVDDADLDDA